MSVFPSFFRSSSPLISVKFTLVILLGLLILACDVGTKYWTQHYLPYNYFFFSSYPYGGIGIFKSFLGIEFSIIHATNKGAAWGVLANYQTGLIILRLFLVFGLIFYVYNNPKYTRWRLPLTLIIAGAIGNISDYFLYGHVIDMLHFVLWGYDYPVFNVADSAIFCGIIWLIAASFFEKKSKPL